LQKSSKGKACKDKRLHQQFFEIEQLFLYRWLIAKKQTSSCRIKSGIQKRQATSSRSIVALISW
jgi:hypothetical protein